MNSTNTIKIKPMLALTYKDISEDLADILTSDYADYMPTDFTGNGLIYSLETFQEIPTKHDEPISKDTLEEINKIEKLLVDNNCDFLMLREG